MASNMCKVLSYYEIFHSNTETLVRNLKKRKEKKRTNVGNDIIIT